MEEAMFWRLRFFSLPRTRKAVRRSTRARLGRNGQLEPRVVLSAFTPAQIRFAYGFDQINFMTPQGTSVPGDGRGQTIAIVDAYGDPTINSDVGTFDSKFSLPALSLQTATPEGQPSAKNTGWSVETALDVEWAHATAPAASILLVEAASDSVQNLASAVDYARQQTGVVAVSMSWGLTEWSGETAYDSTFTTPSGHLGGNSGLPNAPDLPGGVTFVAATGDHGAAGGPTWPAVSPNVVGVGGTSLHILNSLGKYGTETAWSNSGGGISWYESEPAYQRSVQSTGFRTSPDVALNADGTTGVFVFDGSSSWVHLGGTSAAAPVMAGLMAIVDQGRAINGLGSLDGPTQTLPALYEAASTAYSTNFNDIVGGSNGYKAVPGYDMATGLGSPKANGLVPTLALPPTPVGTIATNGGKTRPESPLAKKPTKSAPSTATVSFVDVTPDNPNGVQITVTIPLSAAINAARGPVFVVPSPMPNGTPANISQTVTPPALVHNHEDTASPNLLSGALRQQAADQALFSPTFGSLLPETPASQNGKGPTVPEKPKTPAKAPETSRQAPVKDQGKVTWSSQEADQFWSQMSTNGTQDNTTAATILESGSPLGAALLILSSYQFAPAPTPESDRKPHL
jgi:hypothetical protein